MSPDSLAFAIGIAIAITADTSDYFVVVRLCNSVTRLESQFVRKTLAMVMLAGSLCQVALADGGLARSNRSAPVVEDSRQPLSCACQTAAQIVRFCTALKSPPAWHLIESVPSTCGYRQMATVSRAGAHTSAATLQSQSVRLQI
jgi:hypothetical protein